MPELALEALGVRELGPVDLVVAAGECAAIGGPSGSGKSLLLRAVADLDPHRGHVRLDGTEQGSLDGPGWRRRVGLLRPEPRWWYESVGEHFAAAPGEDLERLGFGREVLRARVAQLSSGERQRLALLRLLANRPGALLLDEPTAHLDADTAAQVEALLRDYRERERAAVVWVTHDPAQARRVATRCYRLSEGQLTPVENP